MDEKNFNPRTPCGVRLLFVPKLGETSEFQSTHPLRGATIRLDMGDTMHVISIHAPLAGCDRILITKSKLRTDFNPRTPCGVRLCNRLAIPVHEVFQSTHPLRGATPVGGRFYCHRKISIHAPLAGCDKAEAHTLTIPVISIHAPLAGCDMGRTDCKALDCDFNPRTPCGVRLSATAMPS